jgi:hypothetical protein
MTHHVALAPSIAALQKVQFDHLVGAVIEAAAISETASATASSTETTSTDQ